MRVSPSFAETYVRRRSVRLGQVDKALGRIAVARTSMGNAWRRWIGLLGAVTLSGLLAIPALAVGTVTQVINCGGGGNSLAASIADFALTPVTFSVVAQDSTGNLTLSAAEIGCAAQGWNVTIQASAWARDGGGTSIPDTAFSLTQVNTPSVVSGQGIDGNGGPKVVNSVGVLNTSRKVIQANPGYGLGAYAQSLGVKLTIPGVTLPGTYKTTITTTMSTSP